MAKMTMKKKSTFALKWKKVVVWRALIKNDWQGYSVRERTKKACAAKRKERGEEDYKACEKVVIPYQDIFDLATAICKSEAGCIAVEITEDEFKRGDF